VLFKGLQILPSEIPPVIPFFEFWEVAGHLLLCVGYVFVYAWGVTFFCMGYAFWIQLNQEKKLL
jgi:hypothetical protein